MDTTKKGDKLEEKAYQFFEEEISKGRFWCSKELCHIYAKKGYYSKDREKNIVFDVSIEIYLPGQETYSLLVLIECKNYNHKVPVDDVEEFFSKIQQISGANAKGIIFSSNAFQEGAFKFSKSKGIGLLRYYDRNQLDWILTRSPSSLVSSAHAINEWHNAYKGLHSQSFKSNYLDCYGYAAEKYTNSLRLFISELIKDGISKEIKESLTAIETSYTTDFPLVSYKEEREIEIQCELILKTIGYIDGPVPLDDICEILKEKYALKAHVNWILDDGVLGKITFYPLEIYIDDTQCETQERKRFTLAHELGHFLLGHSKYMTGELCHEANVNLDNPVDIGIKDVMRMEWQANQFASCLLLPKNEFVQTFLIEADRNELINRGFGILYLDNQKCNLDSYYKVTNLLMKKYNVSRSVVKIRLKKLGLLKEGV